MGYTSLDDRHNIGYVHPLWIDVEAGLLIHYLRKKMNNTAHIYIYKQRLIQETSNKFIFTKAV